MIITVRVKPRSKKTGAEFSADGTLVLKIHEPPVDGKANAAVINQLAQIFGISKSAVRIVGGESSRIKRVEVPDGSVSAIL